MRKRSTPIPVNNFGGEAGEGIVIEKLSFADLPKLEDWGPAERHDRHSFFLVEKGSVTIEIDFKVYEIIAPSIIYMHPNQVHLIKAFKNVTVSSWAIDNENLNADYLKLLEEITPAKPMLLNDVTLSIISDAVSLCIKFSERKGINLYHSLLKDSCNTLVGLVISLYLEQENPAGKTSRFDVITKAFNKSLEQNFTQLKRPADYSRILNVSTPYLNECVKNATGYSVSYHVQQRTILEAKRLLYHSNLSVKEIAAALGYDDYPYFSRVFTKATGMSALTFRNKNLG